MFCFVQGSECQVNNFDYPRSTQMACHWDQWLMAAGYYLRLKYKEAFLRRIRIPDACGVIGCRRKHAATLLE